MEIFQPSLFPSRKGEFKPEEFKNAIHDTPFLECVKNGLNHGFRRMREVFATGDMSMRNESNFLHEAIFNSIKTQINTYMPDWDISFSANKIGSERLFFTFKNYIFILKIAGVKTNNTELSRRIENQETDKHIITLEYTLDDMRESIQSACFQYKNGKSSTYIISIPLQQTFEMQVETQQENTIEVKKPILKVSRKKQSKV
jgi:hypothetical protein